MARRFRTAGVDPFADLTRKVAILEQEMRVQREVMERLKQGPVRREVGKHLSTVSAKRTA